MLQNDVCRLLCVYAGIGGDLFSVDPKLLQEYIDTHREQDFAADVYRVVDEALADFGLRPS